MYDIFSNNSNLSLIFIILINSVVNFKPRPLIFNCTMLHKPFFSVVSYSKITASLEPSLILVCEQIVLIIITTT